MCEVVFQKEQRVVRVAHFLSRILRNVVGLLTTLVPLNSFVILPARSHSRDWHLASCSSVTIKIQHWIINFTRCSASMGEVWAQEQLTVHVQHEPHRHRMEQTQHMVVLCCFFSHGSIQNGSQGMLWSQISWTCVQSVQCYVPWCVVSSSCFVLRTIKTNALCVSDSASHMLSTNPKEKLGSFVAKVTGHSQRRESSPTISLSLNWAWIATIALWWPRLKSEGINGSLCSPPWVSLTLRTSLVSFSQRKVDGLS